MVIEKLRARGFVHEVVGVTGDAMDKQFFECQASKIQSTRNSQLFCNVFIDIVLSKPIDVEELERYFHQRGLVTVELT